MERILTRRGEPVELTPKGFELLTVFVENHGRLLGKDELMERIWPDSFVEENNLTFNIRQLRIALGDDAHRPKYIKTVRRHGYRFIADVRLISQSDQKPAAAADLSPAETAFRFGKFLTPLLAGAIVLLTVALLAGLWYARRAGRAANLPLLAAPFSSEKLSTNGRVRYAVISPDGKNAIYVNGTGLDKQGVWLRQLDGGGNIEILPASDDVYTGLAFAPDGRTFYFARRPRQTNEPAGIYRVSVFGGVPEKILAETEGAMSLSPDGARISFVRCTPREEDACTLLVADADDGKNERRLVTRTAPERIFDNKFSPDGAQIAFAAGQMENAANAVSLAAVDLATGRERLLTEEKFFNIGRIVWLPDDRGWLLTASRATGITSQIWQVSAPGGEALPLTNDAVSYSQLSLDEDGTKAVSTQVKWEFHIRLLDLENPSETRELTDGYSAVFAPGGRIYYSSAMAGSSEIWSIDADGSNRRQLTSDRAGVGEPLVSPDGGSIFFGSNVTGAAHVWRMRPDGSNKTRLTQKTGGFPLAVSADGEWVYFLHAIDRNLWRVSLASGEEELVHKEPREALAVSPDGAQIAFAERKDDVYSLIVAALADGRVLKSFPLADQKNLVRKIGWIPGGKNLAYVSASREKDNNVLWQQPLDGGPPRQLAALGDRELNGLNLPFSPDGKTLAVVQGEWLRDAVLLKGFR